MQNTLQSETIGKIISINGPVIQVKGFSNHSIGDMVRIGKNLNLIGEIIKIFKNYSVIQCYEETAGLKLNDTVRNTLFPLSMDLGPGLLGAIFDGIQRPLTELGNISGDFITRGIDVSPLNVETKWHYKPLVKTGEEVNSGDIIGYVMEKAIEHKIMVPHGVSGTLVENSEKEINLTETAFSIKNKDNNAKDYTLLQKWSIRIPRPYKKRFSATKPLITGTRVIDLLFPIPQGGVVAVPGGFGTGKTVVQHSLAKFADVDIIVYIGCGERGNEMADLLTSFPKLEDPIHHRPLMDRTVMIANTSNMPVSAREASIFAGITIAEYWRDQGKNVLLLADSTSRWAEALRELSGRLEEMPTEGGYPAYLSERLGQFYERAGYIEPIGSPSRTGSVTVTGAVSPPGGDFSEPVTKNTKRFVQAFWALDARLAYARHYPSINWTDSYSTYDGLADYWEEHIEEGWTESRTEVNTILSQADDLQNIAQLIGKENMPPEQQLILFTSDIIKNGFLIQNAFDEVDRFSSPQKTMKIIKIIIQFYNESLNLLKTGVPFFRIRDMDCVSKIRRMRLDVSNTQMEEFDPIIKDIAHSFMEVKSSYSKLF